MNDIICEIILCFFAALGFSDFVKFIINIVASSKIKGEYSILIDKSDDAENFDFLIRQLESSVIKGSSFNITRIAVSDNIDIDDAEYARLRTAFGNISKIHIGPTDED